MEANACLMLWPKKKIILLQIKKVPKYCTYLHTEFQVNGNKYTEGSTKHPLLKQLSLDLFKIESSGLKKHDSFSRWMSKELGEVVDLGIKSSSDALWSSIEIVNAADGPSAPTNEQLDAYAVSPSLAQDQLFSILDISPSCSYIGLKTKVCNLFYISNYCQS